MCKACDEEACFQIKLLRANQVALLQQHDAQELPCSVLFCAARTLLRLLSVISKPSIARREKRKLQSFYLVQTRIKMLPTPESPNMGYRSLSRGFDNSLWTHGTEALIRRKALHLGTSYRAGFDQLTVAHALLAYASLFSTSPILPPLPWTHLQQRNPNPRVLVVTSADCAIRVVVHDAVVTGVDPTSYMSTGIVESLLITPVHERDIPPVGAAVGVGWVPVLAGGTVGFLESEGRHKRKRKARRTTGATRIHSIFQHRRPAQESTEESTRREAKKRRESYPGFIPVYSHAIEPELASWTYEAFLRNARLNVLL